MKWRCVNWGSYSDDTPTETAPIQGGDVAPLPTYENPNS